MFVRSKLHGAFNHHSKTDSIGDIILWPRPAFTHPSAHFSDEDDASSTISTSTNATIDNNPGPGRLIDKYLYQRGGRKLEYFIFRIKLHGLSPAQIYRHFETHYGGSLQHRYEDDISGKLSDVLQHISYDKRGSVNISGLKSLVQQTKSKSLYRSSAALASLIRVSILLDNFAAFYVGVSRREPLFQMESLSICIGQATPYERRFGLFLVQLAKANIISLNLREPTTEFGHDLRSKLSWLLNESRDSNDDLLELVSDVCVIFARAISCMHRSTRPTVKHIHILDTVYYCMIFFFQSISAICRQANALDLKSQQFAYMVMSTLVRWLDSGLCACYSLGVSIGRHSIGILYSEINLICIFNSLTMNENWLPSFYRLVSRNPDFMQITGHLPRKTQASIIAECEKSTLFRDYIALSMQRSSRLLSSFTELKWEVHDSTLITDLRKEPIETRFPFENSYSDYTKPPFHQLRQARLAQVPENELTRRFRRAREETQEYKDTGKISKQGWDASIWRSYKLDCLWKNMHAPNFRSVLDWDWDLAESLRDLFDLKDSESASPADTKLLSVHVESSDNKESQRDVWNVNSEMLKEDLPKTIRIPYKTETGAVAYITYSPN